MRARARRLAALCAVAAAVGCGQDNVVIATIDDGVDAARIACVVSDAGSRCPSGQFCRLDSCHSTFGTCEAIRSADACPADYSPECGCSGLTYLNKCLRQAASESLASSTICGSLPQGPTTPCGPGRKCLAGSSCSSVPGFSFDLVDAGPNVSENVCRAVAVIGMYGGCWVTPPKCPSSGSTHLSSCSGPCIEGCAAIKAGGAVFPCELRDAGDE